MNQRTEIDISGIVALTGLSLRVVQLALNERGAPKAKRKESYRRIFDRRAAKAFFAKRRRASR